jgi:thimet oligopeptidase
MLESPTRQMVPLLDHHQTPAGLRAKVDAALEACTAELSKLVAIPPEQRTFTNTVEALEESVARALDVIQRLTIWKELHLDPQVREAAAEAEEKASKYFVELSARRDLYAAVKAWEEGPGKQVQLDPQQQRLLSITLRDFRRSGLALDDASLAKLVDLRRRLASLSTEFSKHLNEDVSSVEVSAEELAGVPEANVRRYKKTEAGRYVVTTKYPDYVPFMENARSADARRRLYVAFNTRQADKNLPILTEGIRLRDEAARMLGYATHADYVAEDRMSGTSAKVRDFLGDLATKMKPRRDADYARLTDLKRKETGDAQALIQPWDLPYYLNQWKKADYALDPEQIREYFPAEQVLQGMFGVYEQLLGVHVSKVQGADVWHPTVSLYEVREAGTNAILAWFYADLFPREGKFGHAACAGLQVARQVGDRYLAPMSVLMANFTPPSADRPSLLTHGEATTLFHEFGHVMHQSLTRARYGSQSGTNVAGDFVEAPSQMLENWMFEPQVLDRISGHFQDPSRKLPRDVIDRIKQARTYDAGVRYTRQVYLATMDQVLHTSGAQVDPAKVEREQYVAIMGLEPPPEQRMLASFGHLMGGYDAGYYGYLWSEVFAADMFSLFEKEGVLSSTLGQRYREVILAKGRSEEPSALLEQFLGRAPSNASFLRKLGLDH